MSRFPTLEPITEETLTDEHVERVRRAILGVPCKTAFHRTILSDCADALTGNTACRKTVVRIWNAMVTTGPRTCCVACGEEGNDRVCPACEHDHGAERRAQDETGARTCCTACGEEGNARVCPACEHDHGDRAFEAVP